MIIFDFLLNSLLSKRILFILWSSSCLRFLSSSMVLSFSLTCYSSYSFLFLGLPSTIGGGRGLFSLTDMPGMNYVSFLWESSWLCEKYPASSCWASSCCQQSPRGLASWLSLYYRHLGARLASITNSYSYYQSWNERLPSLIEATVG